MKPQSLRVGNSVFYDNRIDTIEEVSKDGHVYCEKNKYGIIGKEIKAIPLNGDILVDIGFSKKVDNIYYTDDEKYSVELIENEYMFFVRTVDFFGNNPEDLPMSTVKFLHQLENAFYFSTWNEITTIIKDKKYTLYN